MYSSLVPDRAVECQTFIKKNTVELNDDIFGIFSDKKTEVFYSISRNDYATADYDYGPGKGVYFEQVFKMDKEYDNYERKVYSLTGVL